MYLFSRAQAITRSRLFIPREMRAALGYHNGCILAISQNENDQSTFHNQILISSIPHERRQDLWNLRACFRDRPGILTELTDFLTKFQLDIWDCYVTTREQNSEFVVDLSLDAQHYESTLDLNSARRKQLPRAWPRELHARITCNFIADLTLRPDGKPNLYLKRNHLLARSVEKLTLRDSCKVSDGAISIPTRVLESICRNFEEIYGDQWTSSLEKRKQSAFGMLVADPEFRNLTITVVYPNTGHVHVRVEANNRVGTIANMTNALFDRGFNVLQAYTRNINAAERSKTDFLLHLPSSRDNLRDDGKLRKFVRDIFGDRTLQHLDCKLSFPNPSKERSGLPISASIQRGSQ